MRVKIGSFVNRMVSNVHRDYMEKKHGYTDWPDEKDYSKLEKFLDWLEDRLQIFYNATINRFYYDKKERNIKVHIDDYDVWGMDSTLAYIILPMLKLLKEKKHGSPFVDDEDVPEELRRTNATPIENEWDTDDLFHDRWDWVMDELIWTFEQVNTDWEDQYWEQYPEMDLEKYPEDEGKDVVPLRWTKEGKCDREGMKAHQARMDRGFELFGKYYQALWD